MARRNGFSSWRDLESVRETWDRLGRRDPLWAVLAAPEKRDARWDVEEFFATGRAEVRAPMDSVGAMLPSRRRALDFGCGPGRLSEALASHFDRVDGVDVAPSMIALAEEHSRHEDRCSYHLNQRPDLSLFGDETFDLVYSNITLQHMRPRLAKAYVRDFVRVLAPDGVAVFQVPAELEAMPLIDRLSERYQWFRRVRRVLRRRAPPWLYVQYRRVFRPGEEIPGKPEDSSEDDSGMEIHGIPVSEVVATLEASGGRIREIALWGGLGCLRFDSYRYVVEK